MMNDKNDNSPVSNGKALFWLVMTTVLWGGSFVFNKIGFREIPPVMFLFLRFLLATIVMGLICIPRLRQVNLEIMKKGGLLGMALAAANLSFVIGVNGTTVTRAGFLNNLFVLIVPLLCFIIWRDKVDRLTFAGIFLAAFGIGGLASGGGFSHGDLYSTICALFIAIHIIAVSRLLRSGDVYLVTLSQFATVTAIGGILTVILPEQPFHIGPVSAGALLYCAIFPTVICFTLQNIFQRYTTPTRAGLIYTLDPVWSMLGGFVLLGERLNTREWLGCGLIFGAVAVPLLVKLSVERRAVGLYRSQTSE